MATCQLAHASTSHGTQPAEGGAKVFQRELAKVRTGRASTNMLDGIRLDYYGTATPLNQVASVSVPDPRLIVVKPWEKRIIPDIEKAIRDAGLGVNPSSDGEIVRLPIPPLTQERRKELTKVVKRIGEDARVAATLLQCNRRGGGRTRART